MVRRMIKEMKFKKEDVEPLKIKGFQEIESIKAYIKDKTLYLEAELNIRINGKDNKIPILHKASDVPKNTPMRDIFAMFAAMGMSVNEEARRLKQEYIDNFIRLVEKDLEKSESFEEDDFSINETIEEF